MAYSRCCRQLRGTRNGSKRSILGSRRVWGRSRCRQLSPRAQLGRYGRSGRDVGLRRTGRLPFARSGRHGWLRRARRLHLVAAAGHCPAVRALSGRSGDDVGLGFPFPTVEFHDAEHFPSPRATDSARRNARRH
jgi:hypothetical protein